MKLPWDKNYLKISFHVIFTVLVIFLITICLRKIDILTIFVGDAAAWLASLLSPLIIGIIIAYLLDPAVDFLEEKITDNIIEPKSSVFKKRILGTTVCFLFIALGLFLIVKIMIVKLGAANFSDLIQKIDMYTEDILSFFENVKETLSQNQVLGQVEMLLENMLFSFVNFIYFKLSAIANSIPKAGSALFKAFLGFAVSFYILAEKESILFYLRDGIKVFFPKSVSKGLLCMIADINEIFSGYVRGQIIDAIILGTLISVSFYFAGIKFAFLIGLISGICNLIPYAGAIAAFILSVSAGLFSGSPIKALYAAIIVILIQQIDSFIIIPNVIGKRVSLHPLLVILSLSIFGSLFGIMGMLFAVPVTAFIKLWVGRLYRKRRQSEI